MNQKEAVFQAIVNVLAEAGIDYEVGTNIGPIMAKELRAQVNAILFEGFRTGTIDLDREFSDSDLKTYVSSLQSNWIRKDKRLNGGVKYSAKAPGSRAGSGDPQMKAMKTLLSTVETEEERAEIQGFIDARAAELNAAKTKVAVNFEHLPEELRAKFQKQ